MSAVTVSELLIPGGHGRALRVTKGDLLEVVDVKGKQVADFIVLSADRRNSMAFYNPHSRRNRQLDAEGGRQVALQLAGADV